jgi:hypothetical protein
MKDVDILNQILVHGIMENDKDMINSKKKVIVDFFWQFRNLENGHNMFQKSFMMINSFNILFLRILYLIAKQFHFDIV